MLSATRRQHGPRLATTGTREHVGQRVDCLFETDGERSSERTRRCAAIGFDLSADVLRSTGGTLFSQP